MRHHRFVAGQKPYVLVTATEITFCEAYTTQSNPQVPYPLVILGVKQGGKDDISNLSIRFQNALQMVQVVSLALKDAGCKGTERVAEALLQPSGEQAGRGPTFKASRTRRSRPRSLAPTHVQRLQTDKLVTRSSLAGHETRLRRMEPLEILRELDQIEPEIARCLEQGLARILEPLKAAGAKGELLDRSHREVVTLLATNVLSVRQGYRDLWDGLQMNDHVQQVAKNKPNRSKNHGNT
jgi:hypothetical protein